MYREAAQGLVTVGLGPYGLLHEGRQRIVFGLEEFGIVTKQGLLLLAARVEDIGLAAQFTLEDGANGVK